MRIITSIIFVLAGFIASGLFAENTDTTPREPLYHESLRPQFHFTARYWDNYQLNPPNHEEGWLNDMNGLVYNDGVYHFFAQRWWSAWLHAESTDLIHWKELRPAFGKGGKFGGTQSGGGVVDTRNTSGLGDGKTAPMLAFWSSTDNENQCMSYSLDKGQTWSKYENNPVLHHKFRDPKVFWYAPDNKWVMILYGPSEEVCRESSYGFNGENNDAHNLRQLQADNWTCSAVRVFDDGKVIVSDGAGESSGNIDINKLEIASESFFIGSKSNKSEFLEGDIAQIIVYDRTLSDKETEAAIKSLQDNTIATDIPTKGMVLHLDASQFVTTDNGYVTQWKDVSGKNVLMTQADTNLCPELVKSDNTAPASIHFNGGQLLSGPAVLPAGDDSFTILAVWKRGNTSGSQVVCEQNTTDIHDGCRAALLSVAHDIYDNVYLLFSSDNLLDWQKMDCFIPDSYECPDMFVVPVDNNPDIQKWVVIDANGDYLTGSFDGKRFIAETKKKKGDFGRNFYATMSFVNMPNNRRVQLAWMRGWDDYPKNMPFNQQVSFPCELTLRNLSRGLTLCRYPIAELSVIHGEKFSMSDYTLKGDVNPLAGLQGELFDIDMIIDISSSTCSEITLNLHGNTVKYDIGRKILQSVGSEAFLETRSGLLELRILVDRLSIETYGNHGEVSITNIAYQNPQVTPLELKIDKGQARINSLTVHKIESIWK